MVAAAPAPRVRPEVARPLLVVAEGLLGLSAVYGGVGLMADNTLGMPDAWLVATPFRSWLLPGVLLLVLVAVPMLGAAWAELQRRPVAPVASLLAGVVQVGWIAGQLFVVRLYHPLQPAVLAVAAVIVLVAGLPRSRRERHATCE